MYLTNIGQFCTRWLLQSAPLSLQEYTGPLHSNDQLRMAVERRYRTIDNLLVPAINLTPAPLDSVEWIPDDDNILV